jgi:hypothetical protein
LDSVLSMLIPLYNIYDHILFSLPLCSTNDQILLYMSVCDHIVLLMSKCNICLFLKCNIFLFSNYLPVTG